jgi:hypothetical protein
MDKELLAFLAHLEDRRYVEFAVELSRILHVIHVGSTIGECASILILGHPHSLADLKLYARKQRI